MKKMKAFQFKIATILLVLTPFFVVGQTTKTKEIKKHYNVSADGNLAVDGKYGNIHIETWDKNEVDFTVTIEVTKRNEDKAQQYLDKITIDIDDASVNNLAFKTMISGNLDNNGNDRIKINYKIKVPKTLNMKLKNSYGNLYLQDADGSIGVIVSYGNIKIGELGGVIDLKLSYGNGELEKVTSGDIVVRYSNLEIEDTGNVEVSNSYSNIDFGNSKDVDLTNKYGNLTWKSLHKLDGYSKYGNVKVSKLYESLKFDVMYGGGIKVGWISKDFKNIDIESSYAAVSLKFEKGMSAVLDAEMKYCDLKNYDIEFDHSFIDESGSMKYYRGKLGTGSYTSKIKIVSGYGTVKIGYTD
jgi:hypothetical protein